MLKRNDLTEKEENLLNFIVDEMDKRGVQPTYREMASHFESDPKTIGDRIEAMEKKGVIKRTRQSRNIVILQDRGIPTFSRTENFSHLFDDSLNKNIKGIWHLTYPRKLLISLEASEILNKWLLQFKRSKDILIPVPMDLLAKDLFKYDVEKDYLESGIPGKLFDKEKLIVVNIEDTPQRQKFTIGHELGHLHLHHQKISATTSKLKELEADYFSSSILMPPKPFSQFARKFLMKSSLTESELIDKMNKAFDVSREAARIRLLEFDFLPIRTVIKS